MVCNKLVTLQVVTNLSLFFLKHQISFECLKNFFLTSRLFIYLRTKMRQYSPCLTVGQLLDNFTVQTGSTNMIFLLKKDTQYNQRILSVINPVQGWYAYF